MSKIDLFHGARAAWMRRNPCGVYMQQRPLYASWLSMRQCRRLRIRRRLAAEDNAMDRLFRLHKGFTRASPAVRVYDRKLAFGSFDWIKD